MISDFSDKFGASYSNSVGFIAEISEDDADFQHLFGGESWKVIDKNPIADGPALLFVLDLNDPKLCSLDIKGLRELPICSYINSDVWLNEQTFKINANKNEVLLISKSSKNINVADVEDFLPNPLPKKGIKLRKMKDSEYPVDEKSYWENTDDFLGGGSFVRVCGSPLWLQEVSPTKCSCNSNMKHIMSIGYEGWGEDFQYIDNAPFFIGEAALYVFFCDSCLEMKVISQVS